MMFRMIDLRCPPSGRNQRILTAVGLESLKLRFQQQVSPPLHDMPITSAASVLAAWDAAVRDGRIKKKGDTVI